MTGRKLLGSVLVVSVCVLAMSAAGGASSKVQARAAATYTGYGFDTCGAPLVTDMQAWLESPFRAIGIYLGGENRSCPDGNLSSSWVSSVRSMGWSLLPLWVGPQAPCVTQSGLVLINPSTAGYEGKAAADGAAERAAYFGIGPGYPIYYDMEGYATNNASCTQTVQTFVSAWVEELHVLGYTAGVYGSANSTIRDLVPLLEQGSTGVPDEIWIARWNGVEDVYGEPVVSDSYWADHQRIHQYQGGHYETWGGVTLKIDSDYVDGAVVEAAAVLPTEPPAGTASTADGLAYVNWWTNSFPSTATVTLTSSPLTTPTQGFDADSYILQLAVTDTATNLPVSQFGTLLQIHVGSPRTGAVPAFSTDGLSWTPIKRVSSAALPVGDATGYQLQADGSIDIYTLVPGYFGLMHDVEAPTTPDPLTGRFSKRKLQLSWQASSDNSGQIASYVVTLNRVPLLTVAGTDTKASVTRFKTKGWSVFRVIAVDPAGNQSAPTSQAVSVKRLARPKKLPRAIPAWAWSMLKWQAKGKTGKRPHGAPRVLPSWYWRWAAWQTNPYHIIR